MDTATNAVYAARISARIIQVSSRCHLRRSAAGPFGEGGVTLTGEGGILIGGEAGGVAEAGGWRCGVGDGRDGGIKGAMPILMAACVAAMPNAFWRRNTEVARMTTSA